MKDLKPVKCGCGGEAVICGVDMSSIDEHDVCYVFCNKCGIETRMYDYDTDAVEAWNKAMGERVVKVRSHGVGTAWSVCECGQGVNLGWSYCPFCGGRIERK